MYLLVLYFPISSVFLLWLFGRFFGRVGSSLIAITNCFFALLVSLFAFYEVCLMQSVCYVPCFDWFKVSVLNFAWGFMYDSLTCVMLIVVTGISCLVHLYSYDYMNGDPFLVRFMSYLSLFTVFMLFLVTAKNFAQLFLGWEGVGISSYLLISFWFTRQKAVKSALKAVIVNRVGDLGLLIGISLCFFFFKSLDFNFISFMASLYTIDDFVFFGFSISSLFLINLFLFIGVVGKSAQLGLHTWLPDAMEGPTPVSALIHAATMVTAGVFLLLRCSTLFELSTDFLKVVVVVGGLTSFFAAVVGAFQHDLKKIIAYSTCSQLGYMVFACGLSNFQGAIFHLSNHAFFKALLFLSAGAVIHAVSDEQDIRKMGGLVKLLPLSYICFLIGSLALTGFPFLTGFYSKDFILEGACSLYTVEGFFVFFIGSTAAFFTAFYSMRLLTLVFFGKFNGYKGSLPGVHESPIYMTVVLSILAFLSIFIGFICKDMFVGMGSSFWGVSLGFGAINWNYFELELIPLFYKMIPLIFSFIGLFLGYLVVSYFKGFFIYVLMVKSYINFSGFIVRSILFLYTFFNKKFCFDEFYNKYIVLNFLEFGFSFMFRVIDRGFVEIFGPLGSVRFLTKVSGAVLHLQNGRLSFYFSTMFYGLVFIYVLVTVL